MVGGRMVEGSRGGERRAKEETIVGVGFAN